MGKLRSYLAAICERDPAVHGWFEALLYPGLHALALHLIAHRLYEAKWFVLARALNMLGRFLTGVDIHPGAEIGYGFFIDHGHGVVIGETAVVGNNVTIYQGVTLGGTGKEHGKRHPTIGDNCLISAGAKVLGNITIGDGCKVGAGAVVVEPVPPNCTVVGIPARIVVRDGSKLPQQEMSQTDLPDPVADSIVCLVQRISRLEQLQQPRSKERVPHENGQPDPRTDRPDTNHQTEPHPESARRKGVPQA